MIIKISLVFAQPTHHLIDIDITDDKQREALVADITDIYLYGIIPRT